ncbi:hypothetical protein E8E95_17295 [Pseudomonas sp. BN414]|uniref:hypothetical protein n=1 Tax=Pseudomonas sp. BN414 TaxID=2567888 RepID=UPI002458486D|nr:hypothetical protein [Pseudomonas sp. BN414]MDH4568440.1 hypothetical protein [Pseudomonas sp. BN414]
MKIAEIFYHKYKHLVPDRLLYCSDYFKLEKILRTGDDKLAEDGRRERLRHVLLVASQHVPAYQNIRLSSTTVLNECPYELLSLFPYTEKDEIMDSPRSYLHQHANLLFAKYATSGGTTGRGVGIWRPKKSADIERLFFNVRWGVTGYSGAKSKVLRLAAEGIRRHNEHPVSRRGNTTLMSPYHISRRHIESIAKSLQQSSFDFIHAYSSVFFEFTYLAREIIPENKFKISGIFLGSEPTSIEQLRIIYDYWKCPIIVHYGLNERTNLGFYRFSPRDQSISYTLEPLYSVSELYNDSSEIVGTGLWNTLMPIIRYRTKDHGIFRDGKIEQLIGREENYLIDIHGERISGMSIVIDEVTWGQVRQYQIQQRVPGKIEICVVPRFEKIEKNFLSYILKQQLNRWGGFFDISIRVCNEIPLTKSGKIRHIDVQIPPELLESKNSNFVYDKPVGTL